MSNVHHTARPKTKTGYSLGVPTDTQIAADGMASFLSREKPTRNTGKSYLKAVVSSLLRVAPMENILAMFEQLAAEVEELTAGDSTSRRAAVAKGVDKGIAKPDAKERWGADVQAAAPATNSTEDFMADMRRQEAELRLADIAGKRLLPGLEMRERLGVTPQALSAALKAKRMFIMQGPAGEYLYPAFFADPKYDRPVLEKICKVLGDMPGGSKWDFFISKKISLGNKTPLEALLKGQLDLVMVAAAGFAEQ
jgi:hypothetical protein